MPLPETLAGSASARHDLAHPKRSECPAMGDLGDLWRDYKAVVVPQIKATRSKRLAKFHNNLKAINALAELYAISISVKNDGHHIQLRSDDFLANYYPSTRKFFFQRPSLAPTITVRPEDVLAVFLRQAREIVVNPETTFRAWWRFDEQDRVPKEVLRIGSYLMPQIRIDALRLAANRPEWLRRIDPREFEHLIATLIEGYGYRATVTPCAADGGRDIVAIRDEDGREYVLFVECKRYIAQNVGIDVVQRAAGVKYIHRADHSMIVTTARFTTPARREAERVTGELSLVDADALRDWLVEFDGLELVTPSAGPPPRARKSITPGAPDPGVQ